MIINEQYSVIKTGEDTSKQATINPEKLAKLQYILTKGLYKDAVGSTIVEWTNNGRDSLKRSGKSNIDSPVVVHVTNEVFSVEDTGIGLSKQEFEDVCMSYLSSTKELDNEMIGNFGLGLKSYLSLDRSATFTIRKNGVECKFIAYQGNEFMEYDLLYEKPTEEVNGVKCELKIKNDWKEQGEFKKKAKEKLAYYEDVVLYVDDKIVENKIIRSEDWQTSNNTGSSTMQLCLGDVVYNIDWDALGIRINMPIALRFNLSSGIIPTPSRESYISDQKTKELINNKITKVADWFVNKYNESIKEEQDLFKYWCEINNNDVFVNVGGINFDVNNIKNFSSLQLNKLNIKDVKLNNLSNIYSNQSCFVDNFLKVHCFKEYNKYSLKRDYLSYRIIDNLLNGNEKIVLVDRIPTNYLREWMDDKYKKQKVYFCKKTDFVRKLKINRLDGYWSLLKLENHPKSEWRTRIVEWQNIEKRFHSLFIDETNCQNTEEYLNFVAQKKLERKTSNVYTGVYKTLNKKEGDVTVSLGRDKEIGSGVVFEKQTFPVNTFHRIPKIHVCFSDTEKERATQFYNLFKSKYNICIVGKNEIKKIEKMHNVVTEKELLHLNTFKKVMTSLKFNDLLDGWNSLFDRDDVNLIQDLVPDMSHHLEILKDFASKNGKRISNDLLAELETVAKVNDYYYHGHDDSYTAIKTIIDKYSFMNLLITPRSYQVDKSKEVKSLINQILYHQQKFRGLHPEFEITIKEQELVTEEITEEVFA